MLWDWNSGGDQPERPNLQKKRCGGFSPRTSQETFVTFAPTLVLWTMDLWQSCWHCLCVVQSFEQFGANFDKRASNTAIPQKPELRS
jgi:hypothetical protein